MMATNWYEPYHNAPIGQAASAPLSQLGGMLAAAGLPEIAGIASGPFAPLIGMGVQTGLQALLGGGENDELREMVRQRARAQNAMIPQLQAQALGRPSAASRAIQEQIRQQLDMSRQAAAASAGRAGQYGTAVERAHQMRQSQALANATALQQGQLAQHAQQQLMGLQALPAQQGLAQRETMQKATISTFFQKLLAVPDAELTETQREIKRLIEMLNNFTEGNINTWGPRTVGRGGRRIEAGRGGWL